MLKRIITGAVALIIFIPVLFFSHTLIFDIIIAMLSLMGTIELLKCGKIMERGKYIIAVPSCIAACAATLLVRHARPELILLIIGAYLFYLLYAPVFTRGRISTGDIGLSFFATAYVTAAFASILIARDLEYGEIIYLMIFIGAWSTDTFAYFTGMLCSKLFGGHKLAPIISPKKTIEGAVGGLIFCSLAFVLYGFIISALNWAEPNYILLAGAGVLVSVVAQLGDLSASAIKRNYDVKDFGSVFPGHGGVLDRFDSVMGVAPAVMIIGALLTQVEELGLFM